MSATFAPYPNNQKAVLVEYLPGDLVEITTPGLPAVVDAVMVKRGQHEYRVNYWDSGKRCVDWVYPSEIKPRTTPGPAGFPTTPQQPT